MAKLSVHSFKPTILDFDLVERGIRDHSGSMVPRSYAFASYVLESVFDVSPDDAALHIVDGSQDRGVDFIYIDHEAKHINISSCKTVLSYKNASRHFPGTEVDKIISFVVDLLHKEEHLLSGSNGALISKVREIWDIFSNEPYDVSVHFFSNQMPLAQSERQRLIHTLTAYRVRVFEHGLYELAHGIVKALRPKFRKKIETVERSAFLVEENGHRGFMTRVSLHEAFAFLSTEERLLDERLFAENVRYFLGRKNEVNRQIRETLLSGHSEDFWFLNAGLTIVCDQILSVETGCHPLTLMNPQIVNGGQTANVIHEVGVSTLSSLGQGSISVKLIETSDEDFISRIATASNNQSRILSRDLRANDGVQTRLAEAIRLHGYFYQRKRGEKTPSRSRLIIDSARAGQIMLSYLCGQPTKSKTDSDDVFGELYELAFPPAEISAELVIAAWKCYAEIEERRKKALAWQRSVSRHSFEETWLIEGHLHVLFVVGELLRRRSIPLTAEESAIGTIDEAISIVNELVRRNVGVSNYRLFRLASSREDILRIMDESGDELIFRAEQLPLPLDLGEGRSVVRTQGERV